MSPLSDLPEVRLHFSVSDTGVGIPPDKQAAVFAAFVQADSATNRKYGGTGLGLAISARLIESMQGRIWLESEVGKGSVFHFTVALGCPTRSACHPRTPRLENGRDPTVRVVDDGSAAQEKIPEPAALSPPRKASCLRILLVEDNVVNQRLAFRLLEKRGHQVVAAGNGRQALAALEQQSFDVVLMDVQMPEMDGLEATAAIRQREKSTGRHLPIIALTAHAMKGDRDRCLAAGMDGFVSKPLQRDELDRLIEAHRPVPPPGAT